MLTRTGQTPFCLWKNLWKTCGKPVDDCGNHDLLPTYKQILDKL
jgi:hypothetical protein